MQRNEVVKEDEQASFQFEDVFSLRKPRDLKAGLASGLKSMAKGVLAGTVGLVAAPIIGAHQDGFAGLAKGTVAGMAGAVVLPVTGFIVGGTQIVRGVINTPEAVRQSFLGKHWDQDSRCWMDRPTLALTLEEPGRYHSAWPRRRHGNRPNVAGGAASSRRRSSRAASSNGDDFYSLLDVPRDASPELIKKQYYILARRLHPDKNPDDPQANDRFQKLGEAYQVLCNPELRKRYDAHGTEGLDVNFMDSGAFFTALFGSDRFDHLVGELVIAAAARHGGDLTPAQLNRLQRVREDKLCIMLGALLRRWVEEDYQGFKESMAAEAAELANASFGEVMLHAVGRVYEAQAEIFLGNVITGSLAAIKSKGHTLKSQVQAASLALKVYQTQQRMERLDRQQEEQQAVLLQEQAQANGAAEGQQDSSGVQPSEAGEDGGSSHQGSGDAGQRSAACEGEQQQQQHSKVGSAAAGAAAVAAERAKLEEQALPVMLDAMWAANVLDIEATLRHVCRRVLEDTQVSKAVRRQRARGLRELGRIFQTTKAIVNTTSCPVSPAKSVSSPKSSEQQQRQLRKQQQQQQPDRQQKTAKQQMEDAMKHVLEKRMQAEDRNSS